MAQVFRPAASTIALLVIALLGATPILLVGIGYSLMRSSYVTNQSVTREQPVPFSHAHHVGGLGLDCRYCHTSVTTASFAGIPPTETCMTCHSQLWTNAAMLAPVRESLAANKPIHWQRVDVLPDYVYFDHSIHVGKGVACEECHGRVDRMPMMQREASLDMQWCLACHRDAARHLRPRGQVFAMQSAAAPSDAEAQRLARENQLLDQRRLTDCSTCHR